jgi:dihydroorotate dehydrogenase electron transfer subunit
VGDGTHNLSLARVGDELHCLGPIGNSFQLSKNKSLPLLLGGGVGIPPIVFFAEYLNTQTEVKPMVMMGSEITFPFSIEQSQQPLLGVPDQCNAAMHSLHAQNIQSRLCSKQGYEGFFDGYINELAECWLSQLDTQQLNAVEIFACGPEPMLNAVAKLAKKYQLACQLSLEEHMACAVGGCAGCTVKVTDASGQASMKRVCVDGPVFEANSVY